MNSYIVASIMKVSLLHINDFLVFVKNRNISWEELLNLPSPWLKGGETFCNSYLYTSTSSVSILKSSYYENTIISSMNGLLLLVCSFSKQKRNSIPITFTRQSFSKTVDKNPCKQVLKGFKKYNMYSPRASWNNFDCCTTTAKVISIHVQVFSHEGSFHKKVHVKIVFKFCL